MQSEVLLKLAISLLCIFIALLYTASASRSQYDSHFILVWNFGISQRNCAKCLQFQGTPLFRIVLIKWWTVLMVDRDSWGDRETERERGKERGAGIWLKLGFTWHWCYGLVLRSFIDFAWHDSDKLIKINENFVYLCMLCKLTVILLSLFTIHCMP